MVKLNELLGSFVSSITEARVISDIQSVKVAEQYAKHDLLKHFSIPRMRIGDIEMTIPVALDTINEKTETVYEPIDNVKFNALAYKEVINNLGLAKIPVDVSRKLRSEIAKQTQVLEQNIRITKDLEPLKLYCKDLAGKSIEFTKNLPEIKTVVKTKINIETLPLQLEKILAQEIKVVSQTKALDNLNVIVESHKLKEQKPENIIYIKMKIVEDGMEWSRTENNEGAVESKLLPE